MKTTVLFRGVVLGLLSLPLSKIAAADTVIEWNSAMTHYNESQPPPGSPVLELRAYAMAHIAMYNAVKSAAQKDASADGAAAQAAFDVLKSTLPGGSDEFRVLLLRELAAIPESSAKTAGIEIGGQEAAEILTTRSSDGASQAEGPYKPGKRPGDYQFTAPFDQIAPPGSQAPYAYFPKLGLATPFVLKTADQFRAPPPYTVRDPEYVFDFNEVKNLGGRNSVVRTEDQTQGAEFWYEMSAFSWNRIARILAERQPDSLLGHARLFAALNAAMSDALTAGFESKYHYSFWRPISAIHEADRDLNPFTLADPTWEPLMLTPPMPDYISTHASQGAAASVVLIWYFHGDEQKFSFSSTTAAAFPQLKPRSFERISDAAVECALSRLYAGIHFRFACLAGLNQGRNVGAWVVQHAPYTEAH